MVKIPALKIAMILILSGLFALPLTSWCDINKAGSAKKATPPNKEDDFLTAYYYYAKEKTDPAVSDSDFFWGRSTLMCPKGFFSINFNMHYMRADTHYNDKGKYGSIIRPIDLSAQGTGSDFGTIKANLKGHTYFWDFLFKYGITNQIDLFADLQTQNSELWLDLKYDPGTSSGWGIRDVNDVYDLFENLGRPRPLRYYRSKAWELRDFSIGTRYNYYRNEIFSGVLSPKIIFPTGRIAEPNEAVKFGLGPQIDAGKGSFAACLSHAFDLRPSGFLRFFQLSTNVDYAYYFRGIRTAPAFSKPDSATLKAMELIGLNMDIFPDLSEISTSYHVTPGHQVDANATFMLSFRWVGAGVGYSFHWLSKPVVEASDKDFSKLMDFMGSHPDRRFETLDAIVTIPFYWLKIPISVGLETRFPIGGRNHPRYVDTLKGDLLVLFPL